MINELFRLDGKVALVTGGSRGIGREMALILAAAGAAVSVTSRTQAAADAAAKAIAAETGGVTLGIAADSADDAQVRAAVATTAETLGGLDILVNNAGVNKRFPIDAYPTEDWQWVVNVNLTGPFLFAKYAVPYMKRRGWGRIVNVGSVQSFVGLPERGAYGATKAGLLGMTRAVALELAAHNITTNFLCPGPVDTEINAATKPLKRFSLLLASATLDQRKTLLQLFIKEIVLTKNRKVERIEVRFDENVEAHLAEEAPSAATGTEGASPRFREVPRRRIPYFTLSL